MAKIVMKSPTIEIDSNDLAAYIGGLTLNADIEEVDVTTFGAPARDFQAGIENPTLQLDLVHPEAMSSLDGVLWPLRGTRVSFTIRHQSGAIGTDNPEYTGTILIAGSYALGGSIGAAMTSSVTFKVVSVVSRATA